MEQSCVGRREGTCGGKIGGSLAGLALYCRRLILVVAVVVDGSIEETVVVGEVV